MPNFTDPDDPNYECPRCFGGPRCGCRSSKKMTNRSVNTVSAPSPAATFTVKEIRKVARRAARGTFESKFKAKPGDLTYHKRKDGTIRFERWTRVDGDLIAVPLPDEDQALAETMLAPSGVKAA